MWTLFLLMQNGLRGWSSLHVSGFGTQALSEYSGVGDRADLRVAAVLVAGSFPVFGRG